MKTIRFGVIGGGLMGKEFASAAARWLHLNFPFARPEIVAICDVNPQAREWFTDNIPTCRLSTDRYEEILVSKQIDAVYCAVPHDLHAKIYCDIISAGKHLLGEKPFGIDKAANDAIIKCAVGHPDVLVRSSSEFPFFPGALAVSRKIAEGKFGQIISVTAGFHHSSDLDPQKPLNWKRMIEVNGVYGCMGDLGVLFLQVRLGWGWVPTRIAAQLTNVMTTRPFNGDPAARCETWDNAAIHTMVEGHGEPFPMTLETKRIAPGETNTWFIKIEGTASSVAYSTKYPKTLLEMDYVPGQPQSWRQTDLGYASAYKAITGHIFEFGFSDSLQQMWCAFLDELVNGRDGMKQPFYCATPDETALSHEIMTTALANQI
jgi:predicted dehydrogenase